MGKAEGNNAWSTLKRLFKLTKLLSERGSGGADWNDVRRIYKEDSSATDEALKRKFRRDREALMDIYEDEDILEAGDEPPDGAAIIEKNADGRYVIRSGVNLVLPMRLTEDQSFALTSSVRLIPAFLSPFGKASNELWRLLERHMPKTLLDECQTLTKAIVSAIPIAKKVDAHILETVLKALANKKILNILQYRKVWPDDPARCRFSPWTLYLKYHSWYILGELHEGDSSRTSILRVDRIKIAEVLRDDQPHPCGGKALKELENDIRLDYNPFDKALPKEGYHVKLRVTGPFVKPCQETKWFPGESCTPVGDGSGDIIYEVTLKGLESITLWIMRVLECIEVLEPAKLRDEIDRRVKAYTDRRNRVK